MNLQLTLTYDLAGVQSLSFCRLLTAQRMAAETTTVAVLSCVLLQGSHITVTAARATDWPVTITPVMVYTL